jgi:hypothetical protein
MSQTKAAPTVAKNAFTLLGLVSCAIQEQIDSIQGANERKGFTSSAGVFVVAINRRLCKGMFRLEFHSSQFLPFSC